MGLLSGNLRAVWLAPESGRRYHLRYSLSFEMLSSDIRLREKKNNPTLAAEKYITAKGCLSTSGNVFRNWPTLLDQIYNEELPGIVHKARLLSFLRRS